MYQHSHNMDIRLGSLRHVQFSVKLWNLSFMQEIFYHHHHVHEGLGVFPVPWYSKLNRSLHLFLGGPMFLRPFGLYCRACFVILFVSILCMCCNHFSWFCFISFTMFCVPFFTLIQWFFSLNSFANPSKCLKNFICAASKRCSSNKYLKSEFLLYRTPTFSLKLSSR